MSWIDRCLASLLRWLQRQAVVPWLIPICVAIANSEHEESSRCKLYAYAHCGVCSSQRNWSARIPLGPVCKRFPSGSKRLPSKLGYWSSSESNGSETVPFPHFQDEVKQRVCALEVRVRAQDAQLAQLQARESTWQAEKLGFEWHIQKLEQGEMCARESIAQMRARAESLERELHMKQLTNSDLERQVSAAQISYPGPRFLHPFRTCLCCLFVVSFRNCYHCMSLSFVFETLSCLFFERRAPASLLR
jgi:hypothetical protein